LFEVKLPKRNPIDVDSRSNEQFNTEIEKGWLTWLPGKSHWLPALLKECGGIKADESLDRCKGIVGCPILHPFHL
jgi:hypothetical protein